MKLSGATTPDITAPVQVGMSIATGSRTATYQTFIAEPGTPTTRPTRMNWERGAMHRSALGSTWSARITDRSTYASDPKFAAQVADSVLDAFRGFLALGIKPSWGPSIVDAPDRLTIESDEGNWSFDRATAPAAALAVYEAAVKVLPAA
jgi:hypothetical protein